MHERVLKEHQNTHNYDNTAMCIEYQHKARMSIHKGLDTLYKRPVPRYQPQNSHRGRGPNGANSHNRHIMVITVVCQMKYTWKTCDLISQDKDDDAPEEISARYYLRSESSAAWLLRAGVRSLAYCWVAWRVRFRRKCHGTRALFKRVSTAY